MQDPEIPQIFDTDKAARFLRECGLDCTPGTLAQWRLSGRHDFNKYHFKFGRSVRYRKDRLIEFINHITGDENA